MIDMSSWAYPHLEPPAHQQPPPPHSHLVGKLERRLSDYRSLNAYKTPEYGQFVANAYDNLQRENVPYHQKFLNSKQAARQTSKKPSTKETKDGAAEKKKQSSVRY